MLIESLIMLMGEIAYGFGIGIVYATKLRTGGL